MKNKELWEEVRHCCKDKDKIMFLKDLMTLNFTNPLNKYVYAYFIGVMVSFIIKSYNPIASNILFLGMVLAFAWHYYLWLKDQQRFNVFWTDKLIRAKNYKEIKV